MASPCRGNGLQRRHRPFGCFVVFLVQDWEEWTYDESETSEAYRIPHQYFRKSLSMLLISRLSHGMSSSWSCDDHDNYMTDSPTRYQSTFLVRNEQKTRRIIVPHRKSSLAKRVLEVELVSVFLWRLTRWEAAALVDVRDVITCPKKAKHKQSAQLQPWEFWLKQMKFQNIHRHLFNSGFGPSDSSLRTRALNVGVVTQIWATKKHWYRYIPGPSKGRQVVPEGCQFTIPFGFN